MGIAIAITAIFYGVVFIFPWEAVSSIELLIPDSKVFTTLHSCYQHYDSVRIYRASHLYGLDNNFAKTLSLYKLEASLRNNAFYDYKYISSIDDWVVLPESSKAQLSFCRECRGYFATHPSGFEPVVSKLCFCKDCNMFLPVDRAFIEDWINKAEEWYFYFPKTYGESLCFWHYQNHIEPPFSSVSRNNLFFTMLSKFRYGDNSLHEAGAGESKFIEYVLWFDFFYSGYVRFVGPTGLGEFFDPLIRWITGREAHRWKSSDFITTVNCANKLMSAFITDDAFKHMWSNISNISNKK